MKLLILLIAGLATPSILAADGEVLTAKWTGGNVVTTSGNNGRISLTTGTVTAILRIICNQNDGYNLTFSTPNATSASAAYMKLSGSGTTASTRIPYTAVLDMSLVAPTATITLSSLNLTGSSVSACVHFNGSGNVKPTNNSKANQVKLLLTMATLDDVSIQAGSYSDVITATVVFR